MYNRHKRITAKWMPPNYTACLCFISLNNVLHTRLTDKKGGIRNGPNGLLWK